MNDITKLADKWRNKNHGTCNLTDYCADDLESALPKWTKITDDPDTWPDDYQEVVKYIPRTGHSQHYTWANRLRTNGDYWRPLCDLDYPPEDES